MNPPEGEPVPEYEPMPEDEPVPEYEPLPEDEPVPEYEPETPTGLADDLISLSHLMMPVQSLDLTYCRDSNLVSPRHDGRYTLVINKVLIPNVILPCPEQNNIRYIQRWRLVNENPQDNQPEHPNEPVDEMEQEFNQANADFNQPPQNNPPPITLDAMYAAIQR
ncbi:uncharacterized protein LOC131597490 [Vicia villosa]|uniref:uncharacterized protein LOC131597490 n=1 Tax=Vicia villosa TaxID=3911 RepID=UPI00273B2767|nr:uncharacterized protein LOC131597490 [Vicia villosa]